MQTMDIVVLVGYFTAMIVIGVLSSLTIKKQEDFFMGGRGFGKLLQTFAAFGAGTAAQDPINVGRTTWTSGLSGVWSALMWLFITPFYWIFGVWYRRMRHLTLGDWFVERYESQALGVAYTVFAFSFYVFYLSTMFSAISKVAEPLLGDETVQNLVGMIGSADSDDLKYIMVPVIAVVVIAYGVVGGLTAAYWTDLIQGLCIILLSLILIPYGLSGLVDKYGDQYAEAVGQPVEQLGTWDGFAIMHQRVSEDSFQLFGGPRAGEFPLHFIISLTLLGLMGIVVQPHFIATGGGSAKTEATARVSLVTGNFLKRFCTIGWALTALIVLALLADSVEINEDPDRAWGVAAREILGRVNIGGFYLGLVGLMLACLLAALMSSADCYMLVTAALLVRNIYAPYVNPTASERTYVNMGRIAGLLIILGAATVSLLFYDVFGQYKLALEVAIVFAAPFWIGMFWRRATRRAAWLTIAFSLTFFFLVPYLAPLLWPALRDDPRWAITTDVVTTSTTRQATAADVAKRQAAIALWQQSDRGEPEPQPLGIGDPFTDTFTTGGNSVFWNKGVTAPGTPQFVDISRSTSNDGKTTVVRKRRQGQFHGEGRLDLDNIVYQVLGMDLRKVDNAMLTTLRIPPRLIVPLVIMVLLSLVTRPGSKDVLDRYYVKMKTPVHPDREEDKREMERSYASPARFDDKKIWPTTDIEIQKPNVADVAGFLISVMICFIFLAIAYVLANIGS